MIREVGVEELQGPYGPVWVSERFLQLIWLRGRYLEESLKTETGESIRILHPGKWNHQEGPDFRGARWKVEGQPEINGDVEIHFHVEDWYHHHHDKDPNFDHVGLHVSLFPPSPGALAVRTHGGGYPVMLSLLPYLEEDLESLAEEEALLQLENNSTGMWEDSFLGLERVHQWERIEAGSRRRWLRKVDQGKKRLREIEWEEAIHEKTLEVLGYSRNRKPMLELAGHFPFRRLREGDISVEALYLASQTQWKNAGLRPANQPRRRLGQYLDLIKTRPEWPAQVFSWVEALFYNYRTLHGIDNRDTRRFRKKVNLFEMRRNLRDCLFDGKIRGNRFETWVVDALLPLHAAETGQDHFDTWYHWFPGDIPDSLKALYRKAFAAGSEEVPIQTNGGFQGLLDLVIEVETGYYQTEFPDLPEGFSDGM